MHRRTQRTTAQVTALTAMARAVSELERDTLELLKTADLSLAQYNFLRVLRGAGPGGLTCGEVGGRLIRHDPDVTRLADRLAQRGLIERARSERDRRVVVTYITTQGLALLASLDEPVDALHERQLGHMSEDQLRQLATLADTSTFRIQRE